MSAPPTANRGRPKSAGPRLARRRRQGRRTQFVIHDGKKQVFLGHDDHARAIAEFRDYQTGSGRFAVNREPPAVRPFEDWTVAEVIADQPRRRRGMSEGRLRMLRQHETALLAIMGTTKLRELSPAACDSYCEIRSRSAPYMRDELKHLKSVITAFLRLHKVVFRPAWRFPAKGRPRDRALSRTEVARLICAARGRTWDRRTGDWKRREDGRLEMRTPYFTQRTLPVIRLILLGVFTGTRADAMIRARWTDYDPLQPHIDLEAGIFYRRGAGEPETNKKRPPARICAELGRLLARWSKADAARGCTVVIPTCLNAIDGGRRVIGWRATPFPSVSRLDQAFAAVCKNAGLDGLTPHVLRHTCATWLLEYAPIQDVADYLGMRVIELEATYATYETRLTAPAAAALNEWGRARRPGPTGHGHFPAQGA